MAEKETEIILGTGKLLGLFFGLVVLCALFLGLGYSWGRKSQQTSPLQLSAAPDGSGAAGGVKPLAASAEPASPPANNCPNGNCDGTQPAPSGSEPASGAPAAAPSVTEAAAPALTQSAAAAPQPAPEPPVAAKPMAPGNGYLVQVAAVSKQEDAEALAAALRQKQYPVFISPGTQMDRYFHVQVGPFPDEKQAEAMKAKLLGDGYNAIVKK